MAPTVNIDAPSPSGSIATIGLPLGIVPANEATNNALAISGKPPEANSIRLTSGTEILPIQSLGGLPKTSPKSP